MNEEKGQLVLLEGGPLDGVKLVPPAGAMFEYLEVRLDSNQQVHRYGPNPLRLDKLSYMGQVGRS